MRTFIYSDGVLTDLNTMIAPDSGWTLQNAAGINDLGQIVGYGTNLAGNMEAFLLTPVAAPEPSSVALFGLAAALFLVRRRGIPVR